MGNYIKLNRCMLKWGWYDDVNTKAVFLDILLHANYEPTEYHGRVIEAGQCVYGRKSAAERLGLTERQIRTAIEHLVKTKEISTKATNKFTVITVEKWAFYQECDENEVKQKSNKSQTKVKQMTTSKKERNNNIINTSINNIYVQDIFEQLWDAYPKKRGKASVKQKQRQKIAEVGIEKMMMAVNRYKAETKNTDMQYILNGSTFFNGRYEDYLEEREEENGLGEYI